MDFNQAPSILKQTRLGIFGLRVHDLLVENFSQTFFVGGMVRDLLLKKTVADIDIATWATPDRVMELLAGNKILFDASNKNFGNVVAKKGKLKIEITTFRKDLKSQSRYPKIVFVKSLKVDSNRRDFTINSLYLSTKTGQITDYHHGLDDIKNRVIRFIGKAGVRIKEDPLRILRALRFALELDFKIAKADFQAIKKYFYLTGAVSRQKLESEPQKISRKKNAALLKKTLANPEKYLDKYFK